MFLHNTNECNEILGIYTLVLEYFTFLQKCAGKYYERMIFLDIKVHCCTLELIISVVLMQMNAIKYAKNIYSYIHLF